MGLPALAPRGCDDLDDATFLARFEALAVGAFDFRHREHVRLAYAMLDGADFGDAAIRFRLALRRFASSVGADAKYHETLTWAYLAVVQERMQTRTYVSSLDFIADHPDLLDHKAGAIAAYYDVAAITACPVARRVFVLPRR